MPSAPKPAAIKKFATKVRRRIGRVFARNWVHSVDGALGPPPSPPPTTPPPPPQPSTSPALAAPLSSSVHTVGTDPTITSSTTSELGETLFASLDVKEEPPSPLVAGVDEIVVLPEDLEASNPTILTSVSDISAEATAMEDPTTFSTPPTDALTTQEAEGTVEEESPLDLTSPPPPSHLNLQYDTPDPGAFLIDDPDDPVSDDDQHTTPVLSSHHHPSELSIASAEISLAQSLSQDQSQLSPVVSSPLSSANIHKDVPAPPPPASSDEEEVPELYLPGLIIPTMFLPIPNVRRSFSFHLTWWLSKSLMYYSRIR
jgi:hypothetical protein